MSEHISEELPRLLTGDASREVVMTAAAHLRVCPDCQQELVSAVIAHASLTSAHRFAPEIVSPESEDSPIARHGIDEPNPTPLPDLSKLFAQAREDATTAADAPARHRRRMIALAAAAAVVVGGGVTGGLLATNGSTPSAQTVQLAAYGTAASPGKTAKITVSDGKLRVDATQLPRLTSQYTYELWVTDSGRTRMQSIGTISSDNRAEMTVASNVLSKYDDFEVSVQKTSQLNRYSGRSVLRGDYS